MGPASGLMGPAGSGTTGRLARLALLVLAFHLANSILQEAVFHLPGFKSTILMSGLQAACVAGVAYFEFARQGGQRRTPIAVYAVLSIFAAGSVMLTNEASRRVNYPTQVIFKSCKLLFVMALRAAAMRRVKTSAQELVSAVLIVLGLIAFTWATSSTKALNAKSAGSELDFTLGIIAIIVAVSFDALLYIGEEKYCFAQHGSSGTEIILFCNLFAVGYSAIALLASGQAVMSISFAIETPQFLGLIVAFSLCNFFGTTFLLNIVSEFGSSTAVVVTSTRKMATVLCSYVIYPKPFTPLHTLGLAGVAVGIYLHDNARKKDGGKAKDHHGPDDNGPAVKVPATPV